VNCIHREWDSTAFLHPQALRKGKNPGTGSYKGGKPGGNLGNPKPVEKGVGNTDDWRSYIISFKRKNIVKQYRRINNILRGEEKGV